MVDFRKLSCRLSMVFFIPLLLISVSVFPLSQWWLALSLFIVVFICLLASADFLLLFYFKKSRGATDWPRIDWRIFGVEETAQNLEHAAKVLESKGVPFLAVQGALLYRLYVPQSCVHALKIKKA